MYERTRFGTTPHSQKVVQDSDAYGRPTIDGKGKGRPSVRPMWLVVREDLVTAAMATAGAVHIFSKEIKAASAIAPLHKAVLRHDNARR
jgi:hypothetical protein